MRKLIRSVFALSFIGIFFTITPPASQAIISEQPCNQFSWTGEDDTAHQMSLPYSLPLGNTTYSTTYVTTNGTLTFGTPDANFSSYPNTPSISLAGYDWVTWAGGHLSYGVTETGFCVEWQVRRFPQSSGDFTTIKLTVDTSRLPTWSGIVETTGWLPTDLRRGIRFQSGEEVVQISEAFTINGGLPVEMQTCWDNSIIPMTSTCPAEPPPGQCWDGSTVPWNGTCPPIPPDTQCWDGSWVTWSQTCPPQPPPISCWDGSVIPYNQTCPTEPQVVCWDNSVVHYQSECAPTPPDIVCWNGEVVPWNQTCPQVPPPIECWDGSEVNWNEQCLPIPPNIICWDSSEVLWNELCPIEPIPTPSPEPTQTVEPTPEPTATPEPSPSISPTPEPTLEPSPTPSPQPTETPTATPTPEPTLEPSPTPSPQPTETPTATPTPEPSQTEQPVVMPTLEPEPSPSETSTPEPTPTLEPIIEPVEEVVDNASEDGIITDEETQAIVDNLLSDGDLSTNEVTDLVDNLQSDGQLSEEEKQLVSDVLVEAYKDSAIPSDVFEASGLDYEDLPPEQPITLENGVVITAEIADAIEIFENPSELLSTVLTDPGKALKAIANVGADLTPEVRKDAQAITVSAVIVSQIIAGTSALTLVRNQ